MSAYFEKPPLGWGDCLLQLQPVLSKTTCRQLARIVVAVFAMAGPFPQRGISRWPEGRRTG